jgi:membrane protease YdiL (CAAX protease family)
MYHHLTVDFSFRKQDLEACLPIFTALVFFCAYWFIAQSQKIKSYFYERFEFDRASCLHISFTKLAGFVLMGVCPLIICLICLKDYHPADYGFTIKTETSVFSLYWIVGLSLLALPITWLSAKKQKNRMRYPQIRAKKWSRRTVIMDLAGWFIYLLGYEFLFRGILLFPVTDVIGVWPAIAVNIALYSATHIPKGFDETLGAVPLGFVLCILTLQSGTIWIAFFVHVAMAWVNTLTALKYNPLTNYVKQKHANES